MKKEFLFILLISSILFSMCPSGVRQIEVPAVVGGDEGDSLAIQVRIEPGDSNIYTSISPKTGISTQSSEENAIISSFLISNKSLDECTIHFDIINTLNSKFVDGPSAGAAMAVASSAVLQNKTLRTDVVITGTIDKKGNIGTVGGVSEKTIAASRSGKSYFLTPIPSIRDRIIVAALEDVNNIQILDIRTLDQANRIFFQKEGSVPIVESTPLEHTVISKNIKTLTPVEELKVFSAIALNLSNTFEKEINTQIGILGKNSSRYEFLQFFKEEIEIQNQLIEKGYLFTGANNIFLQKIDFNFLMKVGNIDLEFEKQSVQEKLDSITLFPKTEDNWQWICGSEMRINWAEDKLESLPIFSEKITEGSEYPYLYEILYANSWLDIATTINLQGNGQLIDESKLEKLAKDKISLEQQFISSQPEVNSEALRHLRTGQKAFDKGQYLTAIYDTAFAHALQQATSDTFYEKDIEKLSERLYNEKTNKTSIWAQLYLTQAKYIYESDEKSDAYLIFLLSNEFEAVTLELNNQLDMIGEIQNPSTISDQKADLNVVILVLSFLIIIESFLLIYCIQSKN